MRALIDDGNRTRAARHYVREVMHGGQVEDLDGWLAEWLPCPDTVAPTDNIARINRTIEQYRLHDPLAVDAPTLLTGTEEPPHLENGIRAVYGAIPDSHLVESDGVSHGGPEAAPDRVTGEMRVFIAGEKTPGSTGR